MDEITSSCFLFGVNVALSCGPQAHILGFDFPRSLIRVSGKEGVIPNILHSSSAFLWKAAVSMPGTGSGLLQRLGAKRPWKTFASQGIHVSRWLEQLGAVREHCFKSVCALEGSQKRHQNWCMLTNFELSYRMYVLFALQWTRRESPFSIKKRQEWWKNIFKGPQEL